MQLSEMKSFRLTKEMAKEMQRVCSEHRVKMGDLIRRGIELAIKEKKSHDDVADTG